MRATSRNTVQFVIGDPGAISTVADLVRYVRDFEQRAAAAFSLLAAGHLDRQDVLPAKPRDGDVVLVSAAAGLPGGAGVHYYDGAAATWHKLG